MTTAQELDSVINALSRTITELREVKAKLAQSQANEQANLEVKKNLALRINELQKELDAVVAKHAAELKSERHKTEYFERLLANMIPIDPSGMIFTPLRFVVRPDQPHNYNHGPGRSWQICVPSFALRYTIDEFELINRSRAIPIVRDAVARKLGHEIGEYIRTESLKHLQEIK